MRALTVTLLLASGLLAGCAGVEAGASTTWNEQARCEQDRGGGVWVAAAGACIRGGMN